MEEDDLEEDGTGAAPQLTPFQQEVLNAVAAYEHKFTARALTDFVSGTVGQVSRALDALCDADIVTRGGSGADELFWTGEEPDGEPIMEPGAAPAGWQQPPRPQQSGGRAKAPAKTKTASKRRAGAPKKESDMDRFRREGKALLDSMPRVDGGLDLAPGYAGDLRVERTRGLRRRTTRSPTTRLQSRRSRSATPPMRGRKTPLLC